MPKLLFCALVLFVGLKGPVANANTFTFFGEDLGLGENTPLGSFPTATGAQTSFLGALMGVGTESFEGFASGTGAPLAINFGSAGTATMNGTGNVSNVPTGSTNGFGRYATDGTKYWETGANFGLTFTTPQAAFGFFGVDIGDFSGQVVLNLMGGGSKTINIGNTVNGPGGSVLYFGIIETAAADQFTSITFTNTASGTDFFGFDQFSIGTLAQVSPELGVIPVPGAVWLGAMGLGMVGWVRKRVA